MYLGVKAPSNFRLDLLILVERFFQHCSTNVRMLTESFIASVQAGPKSAAASSLPKDAAIFLHDFQPRPFLKGTLKKSSTNPNCLAVTASHIFAAQSDKAIINVYSREKGNQETIAAFPFKITSLVRLGPIDGAAILALGTETGGLLLWEVSLLARGISAVTDMSSSLPDVLYLPSLAISNPSPPSPSIPHTHFCFQAPSTPASTSGRFQPSFPSPIRASVTQRSPAEQRLCAI